MATKWDEKRSCWYCRAIEQSDYPEKAVTALFPLLKTCDSVIDFGAGCGALSVPIAKKGKKVTAVEPSRWMYELLLKRAKEAGVKNIRSYNTGWKGDKLQGILHSKIKPHDMVICANLPHSMVCNVKFLQYVSKISKKFIIYIQNAGGWNRFYYRELYPLLFRKKYLDECDYIHTYNFLHAQEILADVRIFEYSLDQPFKDFNEAMDFWKHRLKIKLTTKKENVLSDFLKKKLISSSQDNTLVAPFGVRRAALVWWKP